MVVEKLSVHLFLGSLMKAEDDDSLVRPHVVLRHGTPVLGTGLADSLVTGLASNIETWQ